MIRLGAASSFLLSRQHPDGGWGHGGGRSSWTEPTAWAVLALAASDNRAVAFERGLEWIRARQRHDGGWAPVDPVRESTWVTSVAVLALAQGGAAIPQRSIDWLLRESGRETSRLERLRAYLKGQAASDPGQGIGWPWYPGTAAWVTPTSFAILALARAPANPRVADRIASARSFLRSRQCRDGGWNHGAESALGYSAASYAETTGIALLALDSVETSTLNAAEQMLSDCAAFSASTWLRLGLLAHGRRCPSTEPAFRPIVADAALAEIARCATEGKNVLRP